MTAQRTLTLRELNRTLLSRQMLLQRQKITALAAVERLVGLQSQIPNPPYIGLWARLQPFQRDDLTALMEQKQVVRAAMMRSTLHLTTAQQHGWLRPTLQPALERALRSFYGKRTAELDIDALVTAAKPFLESEPRSTGDLRKLLATVQPGADGNAMAYAVRTYLPLVQVPPGGTWGTGTAATYTTASSYLGPDGDPDLKQAFFAYLRAFGPATVMDFQFWTGMVRLKNEIEPFRDELVTYHDENGKELFDLPDLPVLPAETPAPVRLVPEYDNLVIAHKDRTRILPDEHYKKIFLSAARVRATVLVDGFVAGRWRTERERQAATLVIEPFTGYTAAQKTALTEEGERLLQFIENDANTHTVRFEAVL
ncbi:MAG: winged helix DNA-binding domain-containing protein [Chloroflexota bacterium]